MRLLSEVNFILKRQGSNLGYLSFYGLHRQVGELDVDEALIYVVAVMVGIFLFALRYLIHQQTLKYRANEFNHPPEVGGYEFKAG